MVYLKNKFFVLTLLFFLLAQCKKKEENYTLTGQVINPELNAPVAQIIIELWGTKISSGTVQNQLIKIASTKTDQNGFFSFTFEKAIYSAIIIKTNKENYFYTEKNININNLSIKEAYHTIIYVHGIAWIKNIIKNTGSQSTNDILYYKIILPYDDCSSCCSEQMYTFEGVGIDTSWICPVYASKTFTIQWIYKYNNYSQPHLDSLSAQIGDTLVHPIYY